MLDVKPRAYSSLSALLVSLGVMSVPAVAQSVPGSAGSDGREVRLTGAPDEPPAVVYAAANMALTLVFDGPLRNEGGVVVPGLGVNPHPFLAHALVLTPSKALADQEFSPVSVSLADGVVALKLVFTSAQRSDRLVRLVRRAAPTRPDPKLEEVQQALYVAAKAMLERCGGADAGQQSPHTRGRLLQCAVEGFSYLKVTSLARECIPTNARVVRGPESVALLLAKQEAPCTAIGTCRLVLVVRTSAVEAADYELELLAQDGAPCNRISVIRQNPSAP